MTEAANELAVTEDNHVLAMTKVDHETAVKEVDQALAVTEANHELPVTEAEHELSVTLAEISSCDRVGLMAFIDYFILHCGLVSPYITPLKKVWAESKLVIGDLSDS